MITFYDCKFLDIIGKTVDGLAVFPFIFIRYDKNHKDAKPSLAHEKVHIKQQLKYFVIGYPFVYFLNEQKKYEFELEAYTASVKNGLAIGKAAMYLSGPMYGNIKTFEEALKDLVNATK